MPEKARFFNAGDTIDEKMVFTLPDGHDIHCNAHQRVRLEGDAFTELPLEFELGMAVVRLRTDVDIRRRYGARGIIQVDRNLDPEKILPDEPLAVSDAEAKKKGERLWRTYLRAVVERFEQEIRDVRARGGSARVPSGFTKRAYTLLGIAVPGEEKFVQATATDDRVVALEKRLEEQSELLRRLLDKSGHAPAGSGELALQGGNESKNKK